MVALVVQSILIFLTLGITLLLVGLPYARHSSNLPLCGVLTLTAVHTLTDLTVDTPLLGSLQLHLISAPLIFLYGPLLMAHANRVYKRSPTFSPLSLLPTAIAVLVYATHGFDHLTFFLPFLLHYAFYSYRIERVIQGASRSPTAHDKWLRLLVYSFGGVWLVAITSSLVALAGYDLLSTIVEQSAFLLCVLFFTAIVYQMVARPNLFSYVRIAVSNRQRNNSPGPQQRSRMRRLQRLLTEDREFLASGFNRATLADRFGITPQQISAEINGFFGRSLPDLVTEYRVAYAKELLVDTDASIKEIYFTAGFQSRSVFNTNFKKLVGRTPSQFRKEAKLRSVCDNRTR